MSTPAEEELCPCGHGRRDHDPRDGDCQAILRPDVFCSCTGYRTEGTTANIALWPSLRKAMFAARMPRWAQDAKCRSAEIGGGDMSVPKLGAQKPGQLSVKFFPDDLDSMFASDPTTDRWPRAVLDAIRLCSLCPVRPECLAYAFEEENTDPDDEAGWYEAFAPETANLRYGIFGGIPGPVREHFGHWPNRLEACHAWFDQLCERRGWKPRRSERESA